jgi:hypothetical protein
MTVDIKVVKVVAVEEDAEITKKDGGFYRALKLTYDVCGQVNYKAVHTGMLDKYKAAVAGIRAAKPGDVVELHLEKNGAFSNLVNVVPSDKPLTAAKSFGGSGGFKKFESKASGFNSEDNQLGQQIGNALTNAVKLAIAMEDVSIVHVERLARDLVKVSAKLKQEFKGKVDTVVEAKTEVKKAATVVKAKKEVVVEPDVSDEDIFSD